MTAKAMGTLDFHYLKGSALGFGRSIQVRS